MHHKSRKFDQHKTDVENNKAYYMSGDGVYSVDGNNSVDKVSYEPSDFAKMVDEKLNTKGDKK